MKDMDQTLGMLLKEKIICKFFGHKRSSLPAYKYKIKYCLRCGKHVSNWNDWEVSVYA